MAAAKTKPQMKLNRDLKKAIHSGDGYDDYMTVYQFQMQKLALMRTTLKRIRRRLEAFFMDGGEIYPDEEGVFHASIEGVELCVVYDQDGDVSDYSISGIKGKSHVAKRILNLFFDEHMIPIFENLITLTDEQLKDMDNDNTLRGLFELRDIMRGDKYLTAAAISGIEIATEEDRNELFGLVEDDE